MICCGSSKEKNKIFSLCLISPHLSTSAVAHHADQDPRHLHPVVCAVWLRAVCGTSSCHLQTHWGMVCAWIPLLCCHHLDHHWVWRLCGRYEHTGRGETQTHTQTLFSLSICVDLSCCSNLRSPSVGVSRRFRDRVLKLLQTSRVVLDSGGTCLLRCHPQHDWILAQSHLQEDEGGGMRTIRFSFFFLLFGSYSGLSFMQTSM